MAENSGLDLTSIVSQLAGAITQNQDTLQSVHTEPSKTIKEVTGANLSSQETGTVLSALAPILEGKGIDTTQLTKLAGELLADGKLGNVLGELGNLFGGAEESSK